MKKFDFVIAPQELTEALLRDLYFAVAKEPDGDDEVTAALIENKAFLKPKEWFYSVHLIDDITMADCELICTEDLDKKCLARTIEEMYDSIRNRLK